MGAITSTRTRAAMPSTSEAARGIEPLHLHLDFSTSFHLLTAHPSITSFPSALDHKILAKCRLICVSLHAMRKVPTSMMPFECLLNSAFDIVSCTKFTNTSNYLLDAPSRLRRAWHCGAGAGRSYRLHRLPVLAITNLRIFIAFIKCVN